MALQDIINEQVRTGNAIKVGGDNLLCRAVGRKAAQEAADAPAIKANDDQVIVQEAAIAAAKVALAALAPVAEPVFLAYVEPEDPENLTAEETAFADQYKAYTAKVRLFNVYKGKLNSLDKAEKLAIKSKAGAEKAAASLRKSHERLGETEQLERDPTEVMIKDLLRFISKKAGAKACLDCEAVLRAYLDANPTATLVKVHKFENSPAMICTAEGDVVVRVDFTVTGA